MTSSQSLIGRIVAALTDKPGFQGVPIVPGWSTAERVKPCIVISAAAQDSDHQKKRVWELSCELLSQRDDTEEQVAHNLSEEIERQITEEAPAIAAGLREDGWQLMAFSTVSPYDEEDGDRSWKTGYEYRVVMCEV